MDSGDDEEEENKDHAEEDEAVANLGKLHLAESEQNKQAIRALLNESGQTLQSRFAETKGKLGSSTKVLCKTQQMQLRQKETFVEKVEMMQAPEFTTQGTASLKVLIAQWRDDLLNRFTKLIDEVESEEGGQP